VTNVNWSQNRLTFHLRYQEVEYDYTLTPSAPNTLAGVAARSDGRQFNITWRKVGGGGAVTPMPGQAHWDGVWEEYWPNRDERDQYRVSTYGSQLRIQPLTNTDRQRIENVQVNGANLLFVLFFGQNRIEYALTLVDPNTASGTVTLSSGNRLSITWRRVGN